MRRATETRRAYVILPAFVTALVLAFPVLALAQGRGDPAEIQARINAEIDEVIEELELSEDEAEVTRTILQDGAEARMDYMREIRASGERPDREAMREKMEEIDRVTEEMLAQYLTREQVQAFRELREARRAEARARRQQDGQGQGRRGGGP